MPIDEGPRRPYVDAKSHRAVSSVNETRTGFGILFNKLFGPKRDLRTAAALYSGVVSQARRPEFYELWGVPDSVDGRFDMIALHAFLVMHRLKTEGEAARNLAQDLFDFMFADMDTALREMGVGDLGVGKKVKAMAQAFYGRVAAYEAGLVASEDDALIDALDRNLYGTIEPEPDHVASMAAYVRREALALREQPYERLSAGVVTFGPPPGAGPDSARLFTGPLGQIEDNRGRRRP